MTNNINFILFLAVVMISAMVIVFIAQVFANRNRVNFQQDMEQLNQIQNLLQAKQNELRSVNAQINSLSIDNSQQLPNNVVDVLDIYEQNGVKVPMEIIEDLCYYKFDEADKIFNYIETQRKAWKLENTKSIMKGMK